VHVSSKLPMAAMPLKDGASKPAFLAVMQPSA
jgi:hypothetical protein